MARLPYISPEIIRAYQQDLASRTTPSTSKRKMASLKKFFSWAEGAGHVDGNPTILIPSAPPAGQKIAEKPKRKFLSASNLIKISAVATAAVLVLLLTRQVKLPIPSKDAPASDELPRSDIPLDGDPSQALLLSPWTVYAKIGFKTESGEAITTSQNITFKLYNSPDDLTPLWTSPPNQVSLDSEGYAKVTLTSVPTNLFFENEILYLGATTSQGELDPRIPVSTANSASNLQGYFPSVEGLASSVPIINSQGHLVMATETPAIKGTSGNLLIEGQAVTISTPDASDGDIEINPDGKGIVHFLFEGTGKNYLNAQAPNLTSGSLYYGVVSNNSTGYDLLRLQSGSKPQTRFSVDALGNTYSAGNLNVAGNIQTSSVTRLTSQGALTNITGYTQDSGSFSITQGAGDAATITKNARALSDLLTLTLDERGQGNSIYSTLTLRRYDGAVEAMALFVDEGNARFDGQIQLGRYASNPTAIGTGSLIFNTGDSTAYLWDGSSWVALGGSTGTIWQQLAGVISPLTLTDDLAIGGTDSTAPFFVNDSGTITFSTDTNLYRSGANNLDTDDNFNIALDLAVNGGDITSSAGTFNLVNSGVTTLNVGGAATSVSIGAAGGTTTINNATTNITGNLGVSGTTGLTLSGNDADILFSGTDTHTISASAGTLSLGAVTLSGAVTVAQDINIIPAGTAGTNDIGSALIPFDNVYAVAFNQNGNNVCDSSGNCLTGDEGPWDETSGVVHLDTATNLVSIGDNTTEHKLEVEGAVVGKALVSLWEKGDQDILVASNSAVTPANVFRLTNAGNVYLTGTLTTTAGNLTIDSAGGTTSIDDDLTVTGTTILLTGASPISITPSSALTVGSTGQALTLQGSTASITSTGAGNDITLTSADVIYLNAGSTIELQDNTNITGDLDVSGHAAVGVGAAVSTSRALSVRGYYEDTGTSGYGVYAENVILLTGDDASSSYIAVVGSTQVNIPSGFSLSSTTGAIGISGSATNTGEGTVDNVTGILANVTNTDTGTITTATGLKVGSFFNPSGTITTAYGIYVSDVTAGGTNYSIYSAGGNNYFAGTTGIGTLGPDAKLDVLATSGEQLRLTHTDSTAYAGFTVDNGGDLTVAPSGGDVNITGNLLPTTDSIYDLGSATFAWANIYGDVIYQGGNQVCDLSGNCSDPNAGPWSTTGSVVHLDTTTNLVSIGDNTTEHKLEVEGAVVGKALVSLWEKGDQDILVASNSAVTPANVFRLTNAGNVYLTGTLTTTTGNLTVDSAGGTTTVDDNFVVVGTSDLRGNVSNSTGDLTFNDNIIVTGTSDLRGAVSNSTGNLNLNDNVDITGNLTLTGTISDTDSAVTIDDDLTVTGTTILLTGASPISITPSSALTVGSTGQALTLQGSTASITSTGAGNDITLTSADQIILNAGSTIELQDNTNVTGNLGVSGTTGLTLSGNDADILFSGTDTHTISASAGTLSLGAVTLSGAVTVAQDINIIPAGTAGTNDIGSALIPFDNVYAVVFTQNGNVVCDQSGNCSTGDEGPWNEASGVVYLDTQTNLVSIGDTTTEHKLEVEGAVVGKALVSLWEKGDQDILVASNSAVTPANVFRLTNAGNLATAGVLQAGSTTPITYSRLGTAATGHGLSSASDLLISGVLEVDGQSYFDSTVNVGSTNQITFNTSAGYIQALDANSIKLQAGGNLYLSVADRTPVTVQYTDVIFDALTSVAIGKNTTATGRLDVEGAKTGKALVILDETGDQAILTASASASPKLTILRDGTLQFHQASSITTTTGNLTLQPAGTGTTANVQIGAGGAGSATPDLLVLDAKDLTGNPAGVNGAMYYNVADAKFKCYEGGAWTDCIGAGGGGSSVWSDLLDPDDNLTLNHLAYTTTMNWTATGALDAWTMNFTNNAGSATTQRAFSIVNALTSQETDVNTEALILLDNADTSATGSTIVDNAILITNSGSIANGITDAIDVSDAGIANAINMGANFALFDGIRVFEGSTGVLTFEDTSGNDLFLINDGGTVGNVTVTGDLAVNGPTSADITSTTTTATLFNATVTTLNMGGAATSISIGASSGTLTLKNGTVVFDGVIDANGGGTHDIAGTLNLSGNTLTASGDLTINPGGGQLILTDTRTLNVGGKSNVGYNVFANSASNPSSGAISADDDLFVGGDFEVDGMIYADGGVTGSLNPGFTQGSVVFMGASALTQDNAQFFWNNTTDKLGIGTNTPTSRLHVVTDTGNLSGKSVAIFDQLEDEDIFTASASSNPKFTILNTGSLQFHQASSITTTAGNLTIDSTGDTLVINDSVIDLSNQAVSVSLNASVDALNFDSDTLSIDALNNRIGIMTTAPTARLQINTSAIGAIGFSTQAYSTVGSASFTGVGLDDMTSGGTFTGTSALNYKVEIDGTGTPDTFRWSDDGGSTWDASGVNITGAAQNLNHGVTVTFAATTGHTATDYWEFSTTAQTADLAQWLNPAGTSIGAITYNELGLAFNTDDLFIQKSNGYIGMGIASPLSNLHIYGANAVARLETFGLDDTTSIQFYQSGNLQGSVSQLGADLRLTSQAGEIEFNTGGSTQVVIDSTGKVGIGDSTPDAKLDVEISGAVTATTYATMISNLVTNVTTDGVDKYGAYITSTGNFTGDAGTATNNWGLYVDTVSGADNNYGAYFANNVGIGTNAPTALLTVGPNPTSVFNSGEVMQLARTGDAYFTVRDGTANFLLGTTAGLPFLGSQTNHAITFRTNNTEKARISNDGFFGIGTDAPTNTLTVGPNPGASFGLNELVQLAKTGDAYMTIRDGTANLLMGVTSGVGFFGTQSNHDFQFRTNNTERARFSSAGFLGLGTTGPDRKLDVLHATDPQFRLTQADGTVFSDFQVDSSGYLYIDPTGSRTALDGSLQVGSVASSPVAYSRFGTTATTHAGNLTTADDLLIAGDFELDGGLYLDGKNIYNPQGTAAMVLCTAGGAECATTSQIENTLTSGTWIVDNTANVGKAALIVVQQKAGDLFTASAAADTRFVIKNDGQVTIDGTAGTLLTVGGGSGKIDVGTVDPVYNIGGVKYATYMAGMIGVKEEVTGSVSTGQYVPGVGYRYTIDFKTEERGSDLWLFSKATDIKNNISKTVVLLSPSDNTRVWYAIDPVQYTLSIYSSRPTNVSYRLTAPRFDYTLWSNYNDNPESFGFLLDDEPLVLNGEGEIPEEGTSGLSDISVTRDENPDERLFENPNLNSYKLTDAFGNVIREALAVSDIVAANLKVGAIEAKEIAADSFWAFQAQIDTLLISTRLVSPVVETNLLSPVADEADIAVRLGNRNDPDSTGKLSIQNIQEEEVASIDSQGNATFSGTLTAQKIHADEIVSPSLMSREEIEEILRQAEGSQQALEGSSDWSVFTATDSASLGELVVSDLYVTNQAAMNTLSLTSSLAVGTDLVIQSVLIPEVGISSSINTLSAPLRIQSLALAPVEMMAGKVKIDTNGDVTILGNLYVAGRIESSGLTLKGSGFGNLLDVQDNEGRTLAAVDASGSARFNELSLEKLIIASNEQTPPTVNLDGEIETSATVGTATIKAGVSTITIRNPKITDYTLVYVTPTSPTNNKVLYVKSKGEGFFSVGFTIPTTSDVTFNWWVIDASR